MAENLFPNPRLITPQRQACSPEASGGPLIGPPPGLGLLVPLLIYRMMRTVAWVGHALSTHAIRIERVSEKNADAEKYRQCHHSFGHRLAPWRTTPGSAVVMNLR